MPKSNHQTNPERGFDAVAESRRWKESVAAKVATMSIGERVAWFREQSSVPAIRHEAQAARDLVLREEPDKGGEKV